VEAIGIDVASHSGESIKRWRWPARADNGEIVSESGESYESRTYAVEAADRFGPGDAEIEVEERRRP
jgi:uncharacterized protein YegP (UPF0339 family)